VAALLLPIIALEVFDGCIIATGATPAAT